MKQVFTNFKTTIFWFYLIKFALLPFFNFFWHYILNLHGKILGLLFGRQNNSDLFKQYFLINNDKKIVRDVPVFKDLCTQIEKELTNELLETLKIELRNKTFPNGHYLHGKSAYVIDFFSYLSSDLKEKIIIFALCDLNISIVTNYLGVLPVLSKINLNLNVPIYGTAERGPMLWHKDDFGYKSLDLFMPIREITENNGPLHFLEDQNKLGAFYKFTDIKKNPLKGERNKIEIEKFDNLEKKTNKFLGKPGDGLFLDSFSCYHRGGFCKENYRIALRIAYQTPDSIDLAARGYDFHNYNKLNGNIGAYKKYILFKRSKILSFLNIQNILLGFYRLMHFKN